ncbi:MAG TPA: hypothetical protein VFU72_10045 [Nitrolancea sp.]|nr:hypothetical protein [Nitrolancea sp.]
MIAPTRDDLHHFIDQLSDEDLRLAAGVLLTLLAERDPLLAALLVAPEDDEPLTPDELAAIERSRAELDRGASVPWEQVRRELLEE